MSMQSSVHKNTIKEELYSNEILPQIPAKKRQIVKSRVYGIGKMTETCKEINLGIKCNIIWKEKSLQNEKEL